MDKLLTIAEASKILGVCTTTLRRWEKDGKLVPIRTVGNQRRYSLQALNSGFADSIELNRVKNPTAKGWGLRSQIHKFELDQPKSKVSGYVFGVMTPTDAYQSVALSPIVKHL
ncbi:hypothetical protein CCP3SC5AM1_460015 [Gammaproteobacteria bacterium]